MNASTRRLARIAATSVCAVGATSGALAAQASAATIAANKACYVNTDPASGAPMTITGTGFTPGDTVEISGGTVFATATADSSGNISVTTNAPSLATLTPGAATTTVTATDEGAPTPISATTAVQSANLSVATKPGSVRNVKKDKVTFTFSGFTPGKHIYGYYMRKKIVAKIEFGKASGPCGLLTEKALLYPGGRPHNDSYKVAFESTSRYSKSAMPRVTGTLNILHF